MSNVISVIKHAQEQVPFSFARADIICHSHNISPHTQIKLRRVVQAPAKEKQHLGRQRMASMEGINALTGTLLSEMSSACTNWLTFDNLGWKPTNWPSYDWSLSAQSHPPWTLTVWPERVCISQFVFHTNNGALNLMNLLFVRPQMSEEYLMECFWGLIDFIH